MIWSSCGRNIILPICSACWGYPYLSRVLAEEKKEEARVSLIDAIRNGSVATWGCKPKPPKFP